MNKKIVIVFTILLIIILVGGYFIINYFKTHQEETIVEEYTPEEEITEEQNRQTIVSLYFLEKETNELAPEARLVDIKEIMNTPYDKLVNMLIEGPKNEKYTKLIPENTKLNQTYKEKDRLMAHILSKNDIDLIINYDETFSDREVSKNEFFLIINQFIN